MGTAEPGKAADPAAKGSSPTTAPVCLASSPSTGSSTDLPTVLGDELILLHSLLDESTPASHVRWGQQQMLEPKRKEMGRVGRYSTSQHADHGGRGEPVSTQHPLVMVTRSSLWTYTITQSCTGPNLQLSLNFRVLLNVQFLALTSRIQN